MKRTHPSSLGKPADVLRFPVAGGSMSGDGPVQKLGKLVVLILVGVPGSGKSTFSNQLLEQASRPWVRICQDVISTGRRGGGHDGTGEAATTLPGKKGTRVQCLRKAAAALAQGSNVVIDRCNVDRKQRVDFLELSRDSGAEAHALVLNLPVRVCIDRAMQRVGHEGGLQGSGVGPVVNRFARCQEFPDESEGFLRVTFCGSDSEVTDALSVYRLLDATCSLAPGVFGTRPVEKARKKEGPGQGKMKDFFHSKQKMCSSDKIDEKGSSSARNGSGAQTLAFPSLSTGDFQFDHAKAADVIVETASEFLDRDEHKGLRLVLVDLFRSSDMLSRVRMKAAQVGLDKKGFTTFVGDITKLKSGGGLQCQVIANAANWRLSSGGGGVNAAIYKAAGKDLDSATKQRCKTLCPGKALAVSLPHSSPLHRDEGVTHVIHVVGPNMNPSRPNCLNGDLVQGCEILRQAYRLLFDSFAQVVKFHSDSNKRQRIS